MELSPEIQKFIDQVCKRALKRASGMSWTEEALRSNTFRVKDPAAFTAWLDSFSGTTEYPIEYAVEGNKITLWGSTGIPWSVFSEELEDYVDLDLPKVLGEHLLPGEEVELTSTWAERRLWGVCESGAQTLIVDHKGRELACVSLPHAALKAAELPRFINKIVDAVEERAIPCHTPEAYGHIRNVLTEMSADDPTLFMTIDVAGLTDAFVDSVNDLDYQEVEFGDDDD